MIVPQEEQTTWGGTSAEDEKAVQRIEEELKKLSKSEQSTHELEVPFLPVQSQPTSMSMRLKWKGEFDHEWSLVTKAKWSQLSVISINQEKMFVNIVEQRTEGQPSSVGLRDMSERAYLFHHFE